MREQRERLRRLRMIAYAVLAVVAMAHYAAAWVATARNESETTRILTGATPGVRDAGGYWIQD